MFFIFIYFINTKHKKQQNVLYFFKLQKKDKWYIHLYRNSEQCS